MIVPWRLVYSRVYGVRRSTCNLPVFKSVYTYKASECKCTITRLHCKSSLWNMEYVACGGAFECPPIYRTSMYNIIIHNIEISTTHLLQTVFCLQVRVVPGTNSPHGCWFIASVRLSRVFKVRIRTTWAVPV